VKPYGQDVAGALPRRAPDRYRTSVYCKIKSNHPEEHNRPGPKTIPIILCCNGGNWTTIAITTALSPTKICSARMILTSPDRNCKSNVNVINLKDRFVVQSTFSLSSFVGTWIFFPVFFRAISARCVMPLRGQTVEKRELLAVGHPVWDSMHLKVRGIPENWEGCR
jgi:hypothetical protein